MPGALHRADARGRRWTYAADYPRPWRPGVWRLTYMTRLRGALYAGIQDNDGRERFDYVRVAPPPGVREFAQEHVEARRHPESGGASITLRWSDVALPDDAGWPTDITRCRDALVVLAAGGLCRLAAPPDGAPATRLAPAPMERGTGGF